MFGKWRSPVAHLYGVQGVASSNLVFPTSPTIALVMVGFFIYHPVLFFRVVGKLCIIRQLVCSQAGTLHVLQFK